VIDLEDIEVSLSGWQKCSQQGCSEDGEFHDAELLKMANGAMLIESYLQQVAKLATVFMSDHGESCSMTSPIVFWRNFFSWKEMKVIPQCLKSVSKERRGLSRGHSYGECQPGSLHLHEHHVTIPEG